MKALSLWQPWASFMAMGLKKNETRHWATSYRGPLLIHAAKRKPPQDELEFFCHILFNHGFTGGWLWNLPLGVMLCQVNLVDCPKIGHENSPPETDLEYHLGNYDHGRYMWITDNLTRFKSSIPWKGHQGLFDVPEETFRGC
ncbi:MAG: ASCH domain-containing protein [Candidatus Paceibacterota bacterium]|jgi:hypothetical protein